MAKTKQAILAELDLTLESQLDDLFTALRNNSIVTPTELGLIKSSSVYSLPTVVRNNETTVKERMYGIVTNEDKGAVALMNKRNVLLEQILIKLNDSTVSNTSNITQLTKTVDEKVSKADINITKGTGNSSIEQVNRSVTSELVLEIENERFVGNSRYDLDTKKYFGGIANEVSWVKTDGTIISPITIKGASGEYTFEVRASFNENHEVAYFALKRDGLTYEAVIKPDNTTSSGFMARNFGLKNQVTGYNSTAIGAHNVVGASSAFAVGYNNELPLGANASIALGSSNVITGENSYANGIRNNVDGRIAFADGMNNTVSGTYSKAVGYYNEVSGGTSFALGTENKVSGKSAIALLNDNTVEGLYSTAIGAHNTVTNKSSMAFGMNNTVSGEAGCAIGNENTVTANRAFSVGQKNTANGAGSATIGISNTTEKEGAFAVGYKNTSSGNRAFTAGVSNTASGTGSFAIGISNTVTGEGAGALGRYLENNNKSCLAVGRYNEQVDDTLFVVGNGNSETRKNALEVFADGSAKLGAMGTDDLSVVTKKYVDDEIKQLLGGEVDQAYDTFKEIQQYIEEHGTQASEMITAINKKADKEYVEELFENIPTTQASKECTNYQSSVDGGTYPRLMKYDNNTLYLFTDNAYSVSKNRGKTWSERIVICSTELDSTSSIPVNDVANAFGIVSPNNDGRVIVFYRATNRDNLYFSIRCRVSDTNGENFGDYQILKENSTGLWEPFYYEGWLYYSLEHSRKKEQSIYRNPIIVDNDKVSLKYDKSIMAIGGLSNNSGNVDIDGNTQWARIGMVSASQLKDGYHIYVFESSINRNASVPRPMVVQYFYGRTPREDAIGVTTKTTLFMGDEGITCGAPYVTTLDDGRVVISFQTDQHYEGIIPENKTRAKQVVVYVSKRKVKYLDELTADDFVRIYNYAYVENDYSVWGCV